MLIDVKTTQQQDAEPKGAKRFEFSIAERLTRLPAYFALLIVGIAAYIRSIAAVQASTPDVTGRGGDKDGSAGEPRDGQVAQIRMQGFENALRKPFSVRQVIDAIEAAHAMVY